MELLITKPGTVKPAQKKRLREAGIEVIESEYPADVRLASVDSELESSELLWCAMQAIKNAQFDEVKKKFVNNMADIIDKKHQDINA